MGDIGRDFDPVTWDVVKRDSGRCVYCGSNLANDVRLLRTLVIDHLRPKKSGRVLEEQECRSNKVVSCSFCNCRKLGWNPVEEGDDALWPDPERYRLELIRRTKDHILFKTPSRFPALPAEYFGALYADLQSGDDALLCDPVSILERLQQVIPFVANYTKNVEINPKKNAHDLHEAEASYDLALKLLTDLKTAEALTEDQIRRLGEKVAGFRSRLDALHRSSGEPYTPTR